jgi:hypothetical protein
MATLADLKPNPNIDPETNLSPYLKPDETLLSSTYGKYSLVNDIMTLRMTCLGITSSRIILFFPAGKKLPEKVFSLPLAIVKKITFKKNNWNGMIVLSVRTENETINIQCQDNWAIQAEKLAETFTSISPTIPANLSQTQWIDAAAQLTDLYLYRSAKFVLKRAKSDTQELDEDSPYTTVAKRVRHGFASLRAGGIFILFFLCIDLLFWWLGEPMPNIEYMLVAALISVNLLIGKSNWRYGAILFVLYLCAINCFYMFVDGWVIQRLFGLFMWLSYGGSVTLVLTGKPTKKRTFLSTLLYIIGIPGLYIAAITLSYLGLI